MLFRRNTVKISGYRKVECKRIEIYLNANTNQERAGITITILVSENVHFREEMWLNVKRGIYKIQGQVYQKDNNSKCACT